MREVNFSIPNVNKASVGITTALYDRRALDCTSTLPLINSLNHLAYLTTSSARIRDILTVDGGIERLVCILKQGRSKDMMGMWKWNLAFQCVVNIGVRGTENVRTRVVEADMVPVIATILDNYIKIIEKCREKAEEASQKQIHEHHRRHRGHDHRSSSKPATSFANRSTRLEPDQRSAVRRHGPPPSIDVSASYAGPSTTSAQSTVEAVTAASRATATTPERGATTGTRHRYSFRASDTRQPNPLSAGPALQPLAGATSVVESIDGFVRPVRDSDRLASMALFGHGGNGSQPTSPTTPLPLPQLRSPTVRPIAPSNAAAAAAVAATAALDASDRPRRRPSIRHQTSTVETDDLNADSMPSDESPDADMTGTTEMQSTVGIQDISMEDGESILAGSSLELNTPTVSETHQDPGTFNITHRNAIDGSIGNTTNPTPVPTMGLSPGRPAMDDTRGGIRQCAYYQCGKWEEYTRQFAKCRRCRRTKYCSKECQKSAWAFHRHWCVAASQ
ncbi:MYND-type zinc finger protein samB [Metarhizium anisopliae]|nr:MYND-type zinc finger protein samB [Metarhizium anisopliae]